MVLAQSGSNSIPFGVANTVISISSFNLTKRSKPGIEVVSASKFERRSQFKTSLWFWTLAENVGLKVGYAHLPTGRERKRIQAHTSHSLILTIFVIQKQNYLLFPRQPIMGVTGVFNPGVGFRLRLRVGLRGRVGLRVQVRVGVLFGIT